MKTEMKPTRKEQEKAAQWVGENVVCLPENAVELVAILSEYASQPAVSEVHQPIVDNTTTPPKKQPAVSEEEIYKEYHRYIEAMPTPVTRKMAWYQAVKWIQSLNVQGGTKAIQKQDGTYHLSCQNCGTTSKPLQIIPLRDNHHVVGMIMSCDNCKDILYGQKFDREIKLPPQEK